MATIADVLAFVEAHPRTYGHLLMSRRYDLYMVIEDQPGRTAREKLYNYQHPAAFEQARRCKMCAVGPMKFTNGRYATYCSTKCTAADPEQQAKQQARLQSPEAKAKREATRAKAKTDLSLIFKHWTKPAEADIGGRYVDPLHTLPIQAQTPPMSQTSWVEDKYEARQSEQARLLTEVLE